MLAATMKVLLTAIPRFELQKEADEVDIDSCKNGLRPSLAIYQLASVIREKNQIQVLDPAINDFKTDDMYPILIGDSDKLSALKFPTLESCLEGAEAVGISSTSFEWFLARAMAYRIKELDPDLPIIAGGIHPSFADHHILRDSKVDYVVRGEGEKTFPELIQSLERGGDMKDIDGLSYCRNGEVVRNRDRPPLTANEMEAIPLPAYDLLPSGIYGKITVETSRGCKFDCKFCSIPFKPLWRGISAEAALMRLEHAAGYSRKLFGNKKAIHIVDGTLVADDKRAKRIFDGIRETDLGGLSIAFEGRVNELANVDLSNLCRNVPLEFIVVGIESGYDKGLQSVQKGINIKAIERFASKSNDYRFVLRYAFIVGFPWERKEDCLKTVAFADKLVLENGGMAIVGWFNLWPGSKIWDDRAKYGLSVGLESFDSLYSRSKEFRMKTSSKLSEDEILEIGNEIDKRNFMRVINCKRNFDAKGIPDSIYTKTDGYFLSRTGSFVEAAPPYLNDEARLTCINWA